MKYSKQEALTPTSHMLPPKYVPPKARGSSHSPMARSGVGTKGRNIFLLTEKPKPSSTRVEGRVLESPKYVPPKACGSSHSPMARSGVGTKGRKISLLTEKPSSTRVEGRVLESPKLKFGNNEHVVPCGGRWNLSKKTLVEPRQITRWAIVNFSTPCDIDKICRDLVRCCRAKGMDVQKPYSIIQENQQSTRKPASAYARVKLMFEAMEQTLPGQPQFLLCILPERKNSDIYGPWKRTCLVDYGIVTQCMSPTSINDQYLANLLLKINAKMGGINHLLSAECLESMPLVSKIPTMIFGMAVSSDVPSIAAVVGSRKWPLITQYRASVRALSSRVDMIDGLFEPVSPKRDEGIIRELLEDFYESTCKMKPEHIIIFRDGVNASQFDRVLNVELDQIMKACKFINDDKWNPKFLVIVSQKTPMKFLQPESDTIAPPGTIVDTRVCHPKNNDFYLCAPNGPIGNARSTRYHVLLDQIGFSADNLQELVHSLSYVYQTSTNVKSVVAPICYAHQAAAQMSQIRGGGSDDGFIQIPKLHEDVCSSMFFC